jgi:hypothetical protein
MGYIITSGGRFYWGDLMIDHIAEITKPRTWPEILRVLTAKGGQGSEEEVCSAGGCR